ncbi:esterase/lipase family protein [Nocardioides piscis]|uniref:Alpha/beta fold hydrolase n=1 Tax=Nocardioides piscis TaxID=2714938 RepID=A0A6G7YBQ7_9ACTN|nr:alpha/beta fold hydrolase [Nocardioides piscis]QIK74159.1 alpha/beta fold hydrolase [Nocardioides piscis]
MRRLLAVLTTSVLLAVAVALAPQPAHAFVGDPVGSNDWACAPTAAQPTPVVLVHGTFGDRRSLLDRISWRLEQRGFCVYSLDYGSRATGPIEESAAQLSTFVDRVLAATGAPKVSMVGHSQGGMMPRYYIKFLGGADKVDDLVGLAASNHGTSRSDSMGDSGSFCYSCTQQAAGSDFLTALNAGDESLGDVSYTNVVTRYDEVVVPFDSGHLAPGPGVTNVVLQDTCGLDLTEHVQIPQDGPAIAWALDALTRPGPADPAFRPSCLP